ncbi:MAG TPA: ABC transporter substrate binding protein, partial [Geomobilimonas sp.]|nr:ABC transporter substrate binding protein [Geomobilimonas sp.]
MPEASDKGALVALEVNPDEQGQIAGDYAAKILGGKKASQMPILTPKKVDLIINLRAAKTLGLHVHFQVLSLATKILK